ncbi:MAG: succinyl-diaminopimelate desuccinylase [Methylophilaceae bacterium]
MSKTLELAKALIAKASITPDDNGCQELLADRLKPLGFDIETIHQNGVTNFYARKGKESPLVVFAGHTDVVPPGPLDLWDSDPFVPTEKDGKLFGRGAADMKSSLAAFITSIEDFLLQFPTHQGSIGLLITSDEEGVATDGTVRIVEMLKKRNEIIDYCIVGEPTSNNEFGDTIKNGRRGSLSAKLTVKGIQGHIAYPEKVKNPIHQIAPALDTLVKTTWDNGNEYFPETSWQVSNINGGTGATNVVPGYVEVLFNFRYSTSNTAEDLKSKVENVLKDYNLDFAIDWSHSGKPYLTEKGYLVDVLSESINHVTNITPEISTTGGTSDGRFIADICNQVVEFGPLNESIHKINEHVHLDHVNKLKQIYQKALEKILLKN